MNEYMFYNKIGLSVGYRLRPLVVIHVSIYGSLLEHSDAAATKWRELLTICK